MLKKLSLILVISMIIALFSLSVTAIDEEDYEEWLQEAKLEDYQPAEEDWDQILEEALKEEPITIYSDTSRVFPVAEQLEEDTGLIVEVLNMRGGEIVERVRREFDAGIYAADVVMSGGGADLYDQLVRNKAITRYVPGHIKEVIDPQHIDPVMVHRYSTGVWYHTVADKDNPEVPYENIWELTTEKWRDRAALSSPLDSGTTMQYFVAIAYNADKMEALYEEYFGEPIELTTENAGFEWIKRFLENDARLVESFRDVAAAVTNHQERGEVFVGFGTQSQYRDVVEGIYDFELDTEVNPAVLSQRYIAMGTYTESPNAAKYLINHLLSQEGGDPWWGADFPANPLVSSTGPMAELTLDSFDKLWSTPLEEELYLRDQVADFFILYE